MVMMRNLTRNNSLVLLLSVIAGYFFVMNLYAAEKKKLFFTPLTALDGAISVFSDPLGQHVVINDVLNKHPLKTIDCKEPKAASLLPDESEIVVYCQKENQLKWINTGFYDVTKTEAVSSMAIAQSRLKALSTHPLPHPEIKKQVVVLGTIHDEHYTNKNYSIDRLRKTITAVHASIALIEIPPNHFERGLKEYLGTGKVTTTRFAVFPEYRDILLPMAKTGSIKLIPTAGWSQPLSHYRGQALAFISKDPAHKREWVAYQADLKELNRVEKEHNGDAVFINSPEYDRAVAKAQQHYARFNLGPGSWTRINAAHIRGIERALDSIDTAGVRVLITYGALHKYKILEALSKRSDVEILDSRQFIPPDHYKGHRKDSFNE